MLTPVSGQSSSTVEASGHWGGTSFNLHGDASGDPSGGVVTGSVGGRPIRITCGTSGTAATDGGGWPPVRITGTFAGPVGLLAVIVGSLLYFAP